MMRARRSVRSSRAPKRLGEATPRKPNSPPGLAKRSASGRRSGRTTPSSSASSSQEGEDTGGVPRGNEAALPAEPSTTVARDRPQRASKRKAADAKAAGETAPPQAFARARQRSRDSEKDTATKDVTATAGDSPYTGLADEGPSSAAPAPADETATYSCPWPGCNRTFTRVKSRSAHLKWHGGDYTAGALGVAADPPLDQLAKRTKRQRADEEDAGGADGGAPPWLVPNAPVLCRHSPSTLGAPRYNAATLVAAAGNGAWTVHYTGRAGKRAPETPVADLIPDVAPAKEEVSMPRWAGAVVRLVGSPMCPRSAWNPARWAQLTRQSAPCLGLPAASAAAVRPSRLRQPREPNRVLAGDRDPCGTIAGARSVFGRRRPADLDQAEGPAQAPRRR